MPPSTQSFTAQRQSYKQSHVGFTSKFSPLWKVSLHSGPRIGHVRHYHDAVIIDILTNNDFSRVSQTALPPKHLYASRNRA